METVPDAIRRQLFPGERLLWFGKPSARRLILYRLVPIASVIAGGGYFKSGQIEFLGIALMFMFALWLLLYGAHFALTDTRAIMVPWIISSVYVNLTDELGSPVTIKLGWIDGVRFGGIGVTPEDRLNWIAGGPVRSLVFLALEDHKSVYDLALSAQRAAVTL